MEAEIWIGISSVVIALCALVFTIWQGLQAREYSRISAMPHLDTWTHTEEENRIFSVLLINNGLGPAVIKDFDFVLDGECVGGASEEQIERLVSQVIPNYSYKILKKSYLANGFMMAEKREITIVRIVFNGEHWPTREWIKQTLGRVHLKVKYESVYGVPDNLDTSKR
jgi:hypothetical protein